MNYPVPMSTPKENAQYLDNSRLNKFISEFQQMINRAMYLYGATDDQLLKRVNGKTYGVKGHPHHPCTLWIQHNRGNFVHACRSVLEFANEHWNRGGRGHGNVHDNMRRAIAFAKNIPTGTRTAFPNCAANEDSGINYKHIKDVHLAYQLYYEDRWMLDKNEPKWRYNAR